MFRMCVCPTDSNIYSVFYIYMCNYVHVLYCYFTGIFCAVVRQISMLFIDNKNSMYNKHFVFFIQF